MSNETHRILVAEDNAALASVVRFNLERVGFDVTVAGNGRIAYEIALQEPFDLIISDYQMPEMTGGELSLALRRHEQYRETPIIMLTARGLELELSSLREELDLTAMFAKPFSPSEIVRAVESNLAPTA